VQTRDSVGVRLRRQRVGRRGPGDGPAHERERRASAPATGSVRSGPGRDARDEGRVIGEPPVMSVDSLDSETDIRQDRFQRASLGSTTAAKPWVLRMRT